MVRLHGNAPYKYVLVHGGPGAVGSLRGFAEELSRSSKEGVVEAIQSKYSIDGLIEELYCQIRENCTDRVFLIGHSWGAWLSVLTAERYPEVVEAMTLVGCPPLEVEYVPEIVSRRLKNLQGEAREVFQRLLDNRADDEDMKRLPVVLEQADNCCIDKKNIYSMGKTDGKMYNSVWNEAAKLRADGKLPESLKKAGNAGSRICLIQGACDPHPADGVIRSLEKNHVKCEVYILDQCGHSPFMEKYAKEEFYKIIQKIGKKR